MNDERAVRIYFCRAIVPGDYPRPLYAINSDFMMEIAPAAASSYYHFMVLNIRKETFLFVLVYLFIV